MPTEVLESCLRRIEETDGRLSVFVHLDVSGARDMAAASDRAYRAGTPRGRLDGIPVGIKDIIDVAGMPTRCGSRIMPDHPVTSDASVTRTLREQGAIILGKVATHEFANGLPSLDLPAPPARNPWNVDHHPGGSSSGSGAGVAAGMFPLGIGTDTGGSARHPASACGIVGLKPTYGAISREGVFPLSPSLDTVGLLTRSTRDAAIALEALAHPSAADPSSVTMPWTTLSGGTSDAEGLRIAYVRHFHEQDVIADPEVAAGLDRAAELFSNAGARVDDYQLAAADEYFAVNRVILHSDAYAIHQDFLKDQPQDYGAAQRESLLVGAFVGAADLVRAQMRRTELVQQMARCFAEYDIILCASSMDPAGRFDDPAGTARTYARQARTPFNVTGAPAISLMSGLASNGLPISIQLAARPCDEPALIRAAAAYETIAGAMPKAFDPA
ncbi:hypothetical protein ATO6_10220 [Oceanicola sp. 22II-s10i]|nr:hypothetical protein ATO6_10220 [Oceanicola sp. 22II-s10i]